MDVLSHHEPPAALPPGETVSPTAAGPEQPQATPEIGNVPAADIGEVAVDAEQQGFVDNPNSEDTRENIELTHTVAVAEKDSVEAIHGLERSSLPNKENIIELYKDQADELVEEARQTYFAERKVLKTFEWEDKQVLDWARQDLVGRMVAMSRGESFGVQGVLEFTLSSPEYDLIHPKNPSRDESLFLDYFKEGVGHVGGYTRRGPYSYMVSARVTDQLRQDVYTANGVETPEFTPDDYSKNKFGNLEAVKTTPSTLPGIEAVEETRISHARKKDQLNGMGETRIRLIQKATTAAGTTEQAA